MKYNSVSTYFSKIQNRQLIPAFLPVLAFFAVYFLILVGEVTPIFIDESALLIASVLALVALTDALVALVIFQLGMKRIRTKVSLGERLDAYANWCLVRYGLVYSGSWMLVVALYLTGLEWLSVAFGLHLLFYFLIWPGRERLANDLNLNNAEREVIFAK